MSDPEPPENETILSTGPWPFITHRLYRRSGHKDRVWQSRHHRKNLSGPGRLDFHGLCAAIGQSAFRPHSLNWWIGVLFAAGSILFAAGCVLTLWPAIAASLSFDALAVNALFFAGSIPFSTAAGLQLHQAADAPRLAIAPDRRAHWRRLLAWHPGDIGWLGCLLQFCGTLLFNINTFDAMFPDLDQMQYDLRVWTPDFIGSVLFLSSGYLAFVEVGHSYWSWPPRNISWLVTFISLIGCVAFMVSAFLAYQPARPLGFDALGISVGFTLIGALAFLVSAALMLPESAQ